MEDLNLVTRALEGDSLALEELVESIQSPVYNLALRMLQRPPDAQDACQEILVKVVTRLSDFRGESAFKTWVYRIAANHLLNMRRGTGERVDLSFDTLGEQLEFSLQIHAARDLEEDYSENILSEEVKRSCTLGMLLCLDRDLRLALILGDLFELSGAVAAEVLEISQPAYRKRLSRARQSIVDFVSRRCGLVNSANPCRCSKHVRNSIETHRIDPNQLRYANCSDSVSLAQAILTQDQGRNILQRTASLLRSHPSYPASPICLEMLHLTAQGR